MQTDSLAAYQGSYRLSYLIPALLWPEPATLALPERLLDQVIHQDIPNLQQRLPMIKPVQVGDRWPDEHFRGLLVTSAQGWLRDRLKQTESSLLSGRTVIPGSFPAGIPTLIDGAGDLERWARAQLQTVLTTADWDALMLAYPSQQDFIRDMRVRITHAIFQHPTNPYGCYLIEDPEKTLLEELRDVVAMHDHSLLNPTHQHSNLPPQWQQFWRQFLQPGGMAWSQIDRNSGTIRLCCGLTDIDQRLSVVWNQQPIVLIGAGLDAEKSAQKYRARLGLGEMTCLNFGPDRHNDLIHLYLPDRLPMPNTSHFQQAVVQEVRSLLNLQGTRGTTVILIGDMPLRSQMATMLAAEYGSRVQVESPINKQGILIAGWEYWHQHQHEFAIPTLLIITTLPIPSLENPVVAGRVASYKQRRQDWFKAYLLPEALSELQHAIAPVRSRQSLVALLDNRVNHRSYGRQVLNALSPAARSNHLNADWFEQDSLLSK